MVTNPDETSSGRDDTVLDTEIEQEEQTSTNVPPPSPSPSVSNDKDGLDNKPKAARGKKGKNKKKDSEVKKNPSSDNGKTKEVQPTISEMFASSDTSASRKRSEHPPTSPDSETEKVTAKGPKKSKK